MLGKIARGGAALVVLLLAQVARAEIVEEGVANGRFAELVAAGEAGFVSSSLSIAPGDTSASVDLYAWDFASGTLVMGWGTVPLALAQVTGDGATVSIELAEARGFQLQVCGDVDGSYRCDVQAAGRVAYTLRRSGVAFHENGTSAVTFPDGAVRRVTLTGTTCAATAAGTILGVPLPADASAKFGRYHQRTVVIER